MQTPTQGERTSWFTHEQNSCQTRCLIAAVMRCFPVFCHWRLLPGSPRLQMAPDIGICSLEIARENGHSGLDAVEGYTTSKLRNDQLGRFDHTVEGAARVRGRREVLSMKDGWT